MSALNPAAPPPALDAISHRILAAHAAEAIDRLNAVEVVTHAGERGMAREEILRQYLREIVPGGFEVATGFVIDATGGQSLQQDLIIVRRDFHPRFQIGGALFFPVESVSAVVEVKSTLNSATLKGALANARSVKSLNRTRDNKNYIPAPDSSIYMQIRGSSDNHNIQAFVVAGKSNTAALTSAQTVVDDQSVHQRSSWINGIAVANSWYLSYDVPPGEPRHYPHLAEQMRLHLASEPNNVEPLLDVAHDLWWWLRASPVIDADPSAYIRTSTHFTAIALRGVRVISPSSRSQLTGGS